ncbi:AbrB family transcriptional regulator [Paenibacillus physcomitrellae]|uniref:Monooxygenase n=1 Tax=Paenibacillus physcomitrellae TaxID=1619311 RepID=A0ABQ1FN61_9BACL|nr:AbrB family transcriptional regulator [Paenibacillus physcomitrellae]GGA23542.1 monooxygenase [Paenibacillus physcomitrellae]
MNTTRFQSWRLPGQLLTLVTALLGGFLFQWAGLPIPWLLGPMIFVLIGSLIFKKKYAWSNKTRNGGMILVGYTIGVSLTGTALKSMSHQLPSMAAMTILLLLMCMGFAFIISKLSGIDFITLLMGSIPGGLTQVIMLAEETKGADITIVTFYQVVRLMMIIILVPLLIFSPLFGYQHSASGQAEAAQAASAAVQHGQGITWQLLVFLAVATVFALLANRIKFPTAFLLGPAIATAVFQGFWQSGPTLPTELVNAAQLVIGANVGLMLKPGALQNKIKVFGCALLSGVLLIAGAFVFALILKWTESLSMATSLLSMAPGGMDQMSIMAHEINAELSVVAGYQLFRTFFIFLAVPPLFRLFYKYYSGRKAASEQA